MLTRTKDCSPVSEVSEDVTAPQTHDGQVCLAVDTYCDELAHVVSGQDRAYHLSHVIDAVCRKCLVAGKRPDAPVLSPEQHDRLAAAVRSAHKANPSMFWEDNVAMRKTTAQGFKALSSVISLWAETEEERALHPEHFLRDTLDRARIFQNLMHNVSLAKDIESRAWSRATKAIEEIRLAAVGEAK